MTIFSGGCCAQFNEGVGRVIEDYNVLCSECPLNYFTNETCKYPTCVQSTLKANKTIKFSLQDDQPITQVPKSNESETGKIDCDTFERSKRHVKCALRRLKTLTETTESTESTTSESNEKNKTRQNTTMPSVIFISIGVLCSVFTLLILLYCCRKRLSWSCHASKKNLLRRMKKTEKSMCNVLQNVMESQIRKMKSMMFFYKIDLQVLTQREKGKQEIVKT
ncbi:uncharacterized protein LOC134268874 [Saccostrea cucullata]|uniref:uncharacterized protein LOC134268874 n=1 Tax=Saccostrea cuccullata TaxID=36930 RepID=UPI002ED02716